MGFLVHSIGDKWAIYKWEFYFYGTNDKNG